MKINRKAEWLQPYIKDALKWVPKHKRLTELKLISTPKRYLNPSPGINHCDGNNYKIVLITHYRHVKQDYSLKWLPYSKIDLLDTLAHEIAHMVHWQHTPDHKILENKLLTKFMVMLKKSGYRSEELDG